MKRFLATTAIALVIANGAFAQSTDSTATDTTTSTEAPADGTMTTTDGAATDGTMTTTDGATMGDTTATEMSDPTAATDSASTTTEMAGSTDMAAAPTMTVDGYETLMNADVTSDMLKGTDVYGPNDEEVGEIGDLVIAEDGKVTDVIVDVGGFLGLGEKPVSIAYDSVQILKKTDSDDLRAYVGMTEDQLKELPKYEPMADASATTPAADGTTMEATPADSTTMDAAPADSTTMEPAPADGAATEPAPADGATTETPSN